MNSRPSADQTRAPLRALEEDRFAADAAEGAHGRIHAAGNVLAGFFEQAHLRALQHVGLAGPAVRRASGRPRILAAPSRSPRRALTSAENTDARRTAMRRAVTTHGRLPLNRFPSTPTCWSRSAAASAAPRRLFVSTLVSRGVGTKFPWGTLAVNVAGCLLVGALGALFEPASPLHVRQDLRVLLIVGVLGRLHDVFRVFTRGPAAGATWRQARASAYVLVLRAVPAGGRRGSHRACAT